MNTSDHATYEELAQKLADGRTQVEVGAFYRHYRNPEKRYKVLAVALQEDTEEVCVVYQTSHSSGLIWVRNLEDWLSIVENSAGQMVHRFEKIEETGV